MRLQKFLTEALMKIDKKDVEAVYKYLDPWVKEINKGINNIDKYDDTTSLRNTCDKMLKYKKQVVGFNSVHAIKNIPSSEIFKSKIAKKASIIKPIDVIIGFCDNDNSLYDPNSNAIVICLSIYELEETIDMFDDEETIDTDFLDKIFSKNRIKGTIAHEITHWLDDAEHDLHLTKILSTGKKSVAYIHKYGTREATPAETQAIVHELNYLKSVWDCWDDITFDDLIHIMGWDISKDAKKQIIKRMHRENLLGKKMR